MDTCGTADFADWRAGLSGYYEGPGANDNRKEIQVTKVTNTEGRGFEAWKARRAEKAAEEAGYEAFVRAMTGADAMDAAGVPTTGLDDPGRVDLSEAPDEEHYEAYMSTLDGSAAKRRALRMAEEDARVRAEEARRHAATLGYPVADLYRGDDGAA